MAAQLSWVQQHSFMPQQSVAGHLGSFDYFSWVLSSVLGLSWTEWAVLMLFHMLTPSFGYLLIIRKRNKKKSKSTFSSLSGLFATVPLSKTSHTDDLRVIV